METNTKLIETKKTRTKTQNKQRKNTREQEHKPAKNAPTNIRRTKKTSKANSEENEFKQLCDAQKKIDYDTPFILLERPDGTHYMATKREFYAKLKDAKFDTDSDGEISFCSSSSEDENDDEAVESEDEDKFEDELKEGNQIEDKNDDEENKETIKKKRK